MLQGQWGFLCMLCSVLFLIELSFVLVHSGANMSQDSRNEKSCCICVLVMNSVQDEAELVAVLVAVLDTHAIHILMGK